MFHSEQNGVNHFSGFSVGCCINREKVICYQLEFGKITLPTFRLEHSVETLAKCTDNLLSIGVNQLLKDPELKVLDLSTVVTLG